MRSYKIIESAGYAPGVIFTLISFHQKLSAFYGLLHGGLPVLYGHWQFAYVYENHVRSYGAYDEVEMYVSLFYLFFTF